ncbi:hypothetical protein G7046_g3350 [Stylonectria norvegica]|nr:hypothetical protein G7046_g3350 [Stylonectria norvegica]
MSSTVRPLLTVYRGSPHTGTYVWSPFVTKLEARLRFDGISYRVSGGSPKSAPRGKIPYVDVEENGVQQRLADSTLIIRDLVENGTLTNLNASLSPVQRAQDLAVRALLEEKLYFYGTRERWWDNYDTMRSNVLAAIPWPIQSLIGLLAYRGITNALYGQGTGRFAHEEVVKLKMEVWESLNSLLTASSASRPGRKGPFWILGGEEPTEADAVMFGFIASALVCDAYV